MKVINAPYVKRVALPTSQEVEHNSQMPTINKNARFTDRIKSLIIDLFIIYMPILYIMTYLVLGTKEEFLASNIAPFIAVNIYALIYTILISLKSQTPGKRAYDITVLNKDNSKLSLIKAFIRFYLFLFSCMSVIGILLPLFRKDNLALHDLILNTKVVYTQTHT